MRAKLFAHLYLYFNLNHHHFKRSVQLFFNFCVLHQPGQLVTNFIIVVVRGSRAHQARRSSFLLPNDHVAPFHWTGGKFPRRVVCHCTSNLHIGGHPTMCRFRSHAFCRWGTLPRTYGRPSKCRLPYRACYCLSTRLHIFCHRAKRRSPRHLSCFQTTIHRTLIRRSIRTGHDHASFPLYSRPRTWTHRTRTRRQCHLRDHFSSSPHT